MVQIMSLRNGFIDCTGKQCIPHVHVVATSRELHRKQGVVCIPIAIITPTYAPKNVKLWIPFLWGPPTAKTCDVMVTLSIPGSF